MSVRIGPRSAAEGVPASRRLRREALFLAALWVFYAVWRRLFVPFPRLRSHHPSEPAVRHPLWVPGGVGGDR